MATKIHLRPKGSVLIFVVVIMVGLFAMLAMAVDIGYYYNVRRDLQTALDAATLAGASALSTDRDTARARAIEYAAKNRANGESVDLLDGDILLGLWDPSTNIFTELDDSSSEQPNAIHITAALTEEHGNPVNMFFARIVGVDSLDVVASSIAIYGSRDIVLTLDYSGSMSDDSELRHVAQMGQSEIEGYLQDIWLALRNSAGSPLITLDGTQMTSPSITIPPANDAVITNTLGLDGIPYPYPPGTWGGYFDYVQNDVSNSPVNYRNRYGYLTFMDYLQARQYIFGTYNIPLWETPQQPITAVKNAVAIFLAYMQQQPTNDRVGLASYTYSDGGGRLEVPLTYDYLTLVENTSRQRQAGHYNAYTNISGGLREAREELQTRGRTGALKLTVLLSDGVANRPGGTSNGRQAAIAEAQTAADAGIPIVTISLGAQTDTDLMQQIADLTGGIHFVVPGGDDVEDYEEDLNQIFAQIAGHLPLKLVK